MADIEKLRKAAFDARDALDMAEAVERDKYNQKTIGKCFKYRNSGGGCDEKWWLYAKVIRAEGGHLRVFKFEELPNGCISIEPDQFSWSGKLENSGWTEIDLSELQGAWSMLAAKIGTFRL